MTAGDLIQSLLSVHTILFHEIAQLFNKSAKKGRKHL